jgi:hypothetical protein
MAVPSQVDALLTRWRGSSVIDTAYGTVGNRHLPPRKP